MGLQCEKYSIHPGARPTVCPDFDFITKTTTSVFSIFRYVFCSWESSETQILFKHNFCMHTLLFQQFVPFILV